MIRLTLGGVTGSFRLTRRISASEPTSTVAAVPVRARCCSSARLAEAASLDRATAEPVRKSPA